MVSKVCLFIVLVNIVTVSFVKGYVDLPIPNQALDQELYERVIDPELCHEQVQLIRNNTFWTMFFADAGIRIPRGVLEGNTLDMGNYHQCIGFNQPLPNNELQGKYCMISVPMNQNLHLPVQSNSQMVGFDTNQLHLHDETMKRLEEFYRIKKGMLAMSGLFDDQRLSPESPLSGLTFRLAVCIPRPCTTEQAINSLLFNVSEIGLQYTDDFCRLPDDKPWVPGDTVAVVIFSVIGLITLASTSYDIWHKFILKNDPKTVSVIGRSFSIYTNGHRMMSFESGPNTLECVDGIRALAMIWVLLGHSFTSEIAWANPLDTFVWAGSWQALWVTAAHSTVDTFFTLSGFLVVYTTVGKLNGKQLIKNIHLFWLNRLLRMFPLLAAAVLLEATYVNRMADGPMWGSTATLVHACRTNWWSTLLHIQNYANRTGVCIGQTWYLAIDVQLHILSPIILFWVLLGKERIAWTALFTGLIGVLTASTIYIFINEFPSTAMSRPEKFLEYMFNYYMNTLTRASPFLVGMIFGYIVRTKKLQMSKILTACYWTLTLGLFAFVIYSNYPLVQPDWDNQTLDSLFNSFIRPLWAVIIGCLIYGCAYGYGGPINWFLSLKVWKLHSRLSYGVYLFHYALMTVVNFSAIAPAFFSVQSVVFKFLAHYALAFAVAYLMGLVIDAPCSTLLKLILGGGIKNTQKKKIEDEPTNENDRNV